MDPDMYRGPRPWREVRAVFDGTTVRVYQAFSNEIARAALEKGRFVPPFRFTMTTWIKPSFLWTMARTSWGRYSAIGKKGSDARHGGGATVLAIDVDRAFFDDLLDTSRPSDGEGPGQQGGRDRAVVQWDPEKDLAGRPRPWRAIQIGLVPAVVPRYNDAIRGITDMTALISEILSVPDEEGKIALLPGERPYPLTTAQNANLRVDAPAPVTTRSDRALSRALSRALRHDPEGFGITLDRDGFAPLEDLHRALRGRRGFDDVTEEDIRRAVAVNDKQRFEISDGNIRAFYGHTVPVVKDEAAEPPGTLYHGTDPAVLAEIMRRGLLPMGRRYVHLSVDEETARAVGLRKSRSPVVLRVDASRAHAGGVAFYRGNARTWLSDGVPAAFLSVLDE